MAELLLQQQRLLLLAWLVAVTKKEKMQLVAFATVPFCLLGCVIWMVQRSLTILLNGLEEEMEEAVFAAATG